MKDTNETRLRNYWKLGFGLATLVLLCPGWAVAQENDTAAAARADDKVKRYTVIDLGTLGGTSSAGWGINNKRWVYGVSSLPGDMQSRAFLWRWGVMTDLGTLGGPNSVSY